jgi:protein-S-isoprenylcysteine O-methyltransferase Ste14
MPASDRQKSPGVTSSPTKQKLHFNTYGGPDGPKPILENVKYAKTSQTVVRHQTRPIGEFGGNFGTGFWTIAIPVIIWYVYGIVVMNEGNLQIPDRAFWKKLIYDLPDGIAIRPTWKGLYAFWLFIIGQGLCEMVLPCRKDPQGRPYFEGVTQKNGRKLKYPMNGHLSFWLSHVVCYALCYYDVIEPQFVWKNMGALLTGAVITSASISLWVYIEWGIFWKRHVDDEEFEEDWGVFNYKDFLNDYFLGVARNPRIFRWLTYFGRQPLDVKRFTNARPSLTGWVICNQSYIAAIYYGCKLSGPNYAVECPLYPSQGDYTNIGFAAAIIVVAHWYYIFDYNWNEPAYLTTTDIRHDLYGYMLAYGCMGFLCWYYPISFLGHIAAQKKPLNDNPYHVAVGLFICTLGMIFFRMTNIQKHNFRTYDNAGGDLSKYEVWNFNGKSKVTFITAHNGNKLLTNGFWGLARHFNYIGDLIMCIGWAIACSGPNHPIPWPSISYCLYFWIMDIHRLFRDEDRCAAKYKEDWIEYKKRVPYFLIPGIW